MRRTPNWIKPLCFAIGALFAGGAMGQTACDSVEIVSVTYTPFSDTAVQVVVQNTSSNSFNYPGFILFDQNGDTIAKEVVDLFVLSTGSAHQLSFQNGVTPPAGTFSGTLELWTDFYAQLACSWSMVFDLCPADSCTTVQVNIGNFGGALINSSFDWMVSDTLMNSLADGTFHLIDTAQQFDLDTLCLPPGHYLYWVDSPQPTGGGPYFGVGSGVNGYSQPLIQGGGNQSIPFTLFGACAGIPQSVDENRGQDDLVLVSHGGMLRIWRKDNERIGLVEIFDLNGKMIFSKYLASSKERLDLSKHPNGVYLLRPWDSNIGQRFLLK